MGKPERLDKLVSSQGVTTRSEAQRLIRSGRVRVDGVPCRSPAQKVVGEESLIEVDGRPLAYQRNLYIMMNKPAGLLCVSRDPKAPTVIDLLPPELRRRGLFPAGRLDKDTVGMVLLTDDGDFAHRLLAPRAHVVKKYQAIIDGPLTEEIVTAFAQGISLEDGERCLPAKCYILKGGAHPLVEIRISEGKYHQIKRMFAGFSRKVLWLKRVSMGGLALDETLPEGGFRPLTDEEKRAVFL